MRQKVTSEVLHRLKWYMSNASTRGEAYRKISEEYGISVSAIKNAASKAGITSPMHSLHYILSDKEEQAIVALCVKYSNRGEPLTIPDFIELVSRIKCYPKTRRISVHFLSNFVKRNKEHLCMRTGTVTSPSRSSDIMQQLTEDFISDVGTMFQTNIINKRNLLVFDETIIGETETKQLFIGSRRNTAGGNITVFRKRGKAIGSVTPFSMVDGTTPFIVYVRRENLKRKDEGSKCQLEQNVRVVRTAAQYKLYLSSDTGYMTIPMFRSIMEHFVKWWTESHPGLDCYLICDNLRIHTNASIVQYATQNGVHIKTIMPNSSHWFQVHDQKPFGNLKKKMAQKRNGFSRVSSLRPKATKDFMMGIYKAVESLAFAPHIIRSSFAEVGLWPWNPTLIRKLCQEHCPPPSQLNGSRLLRKLESIMKALSVEQEAERDRIIAIGRLEREGTSEETARYDLRERFTPDSEENERKPRRSFSRRKNSSSKTQSPIKRPRTRMSTSGRQ